MTNRRVLTKGRSISAREYPYFDFAVFWRARNGTPHSLARGSRVKGHRALPRERTNTAYGFSLAMQRILSSGMVRAPARRTARKRGRRRRITLRRSDG